MNPVFSLFSKSPPLTEPQTNRLGGELAADYTQYTRIELAIGGGKR